jgi:site-specific recombinase XerD
MNINHVEPTKYIPSLTEHSVAYREYLVYHGYAKSTVQHCEEVVARFSRWMSEMCHRLCDINETLIEEFLHQRVPDHVDPVSGYRRNHSRSPLVHLLVVLRATDSIQAKIIDMTSVAVELRRFDDFLRQARGFAQSTRDNSTRIIGRFLRERFDDGAIELSAITPMHVRNFLTLQASIYRTPTSFSMVVSSLRGYFRWRMMQANDLHALIGALANPANWSQASLPKSLRVEEVEQLLTSLGRTDPIGLRADAMVRCALDLGLRIGEIARLNLDDIDWENGTITLRRTKGHRDDVMPLPATTGDAIAAYLQNGRPNTLHRMVFAGHKAPRERLICRSVVSTAIRQAYARAGLPYTSAHLLRHTLANRLLATGSSIKDIADILRHRSLNSTRIYAKLDSRNLQRVALPWPGDADMNTAGEQA